MNGFTSVACDCLARLLSARQTNSRSFSLTNDLRKVTTARVSSTVGFEVDLEKVLLYGLTIVVGLSQLIRLISNQNCKKFYIYTVTTKIFLKGFQAFNFKFYPIQALKSFLKSSIFLFPSRVALDFSLGKMSTVSSFSTSSSISSTKRFFRTLVGVFGTTTVVFLEFLMKRGEFFGGRPRFRP